jgi:hypothetical protein
LATGRRDYSIETLMKNVFARGAGALALAMLIAIASLSACSSKSKPEEGDAEDNATQVGISEPLPAPVANVEINYTRPDDSLERVVVNKYFGADVISTTQSKSGRSASVMRFEGGVPVWEIKADRSLAGRITDIGSSGWAVKRLEYGKMPPHFSQVLPDEGPPEPLDRGGFYVFQIERASGSISYQAVMVLADGSLEAYAAQPRAGSSFLLCCGLATDFPEPVIMPEEAPPDENVPQEGTDSGDQGSSP